MSSSSFSLLRLPSLALAEIIQQTELKEQFKLSLCSKRMHFIVKHYRCKSPMSLELGGFEDYTEICLFSQKYSEDKVNFAVRAGGDIYCWGEYPYSFEETDRLFSCENIIESTKLLVELLRDLFEAKVRKVEVYDESIWMLDLVDERQGAYSYDAQVWNYCGYGHNDEQLRHIFLDLNPRSFKFYQKTSDEFRLENFHKKYDNLTISAGKWVTIENLFQLDCVELCINGRYFSNTEINRYLKHVLGGGAQRMRKFEATVCHAEENVILDGIREFLTGIEQDENEDGNWKLKGTVAREEGLMEVNVSITHLFGDISLKIKET